MMSTPKVVVEPVSGYDHVVRIPLGDIADSHAVVEILRDTFDACFKSGNHRIILDLKSVNFPSASLIALLIEATSRARRLNGDLIIVNLPDKAKNNLTTFSPLSYLSLENDESHALGEFRDPRESFNSEISLDTEEIAEAPILEKLGKFEDISVEEEEKNHLRVKSMSKNLYTICDFVTDFAEKAGFNSKDIGKIKIAVYEASLNVIEHAYHSNPDNWIDIWTDFSDGRFLVVIQDYGHGFEGVNASDFNVRSAMDHRQTGGFGLYIIKRSMDEITYESDPVKGNRLTMIKNLP